AVASTGCGEPGAIGCRRGTMTMSGSATGTCSLGPSASPSSASARPRPGGGTTRKPRRSGCDDATTARRFVRMLAYLARRLLLMIPTLFGVMLVSFAIVQFVPGGPVERAIAQLQNADQSGIGGAGAGAADIASRYRGSQGLDPKFIKELQKQYGFDKPAWERFLILVRDYS